MTVKPLGSRLLIRPDLPAPASAIIIAPDIVAPPPEMSGTVIAVGDGSERAATVKRDLMTDVRGIVTDVADTFRALDAPWYQMLMDALGRYGARRPLEYEVTIGDRVLFPWNVGVTFVVDGDDYLTLSEDDLSAVFTEDEAAA